MKHPKQWSDGLIAKTYEVLQDKKFAPVSDKLYLKQVEGRYATIKVVDIICNHFHLEDADSGEVRSFESVDDLVNAGWAVD